MKDSTGKGIKDAAIHNLEAGEIKRGGSTITQQLAKNLYLSSERSLLRKAEEALITRSLEHRADEGAHSRTVPQRRGVGHVVSMAQKRHPGITSISPARI